jgi:chromosome segregation ATPase
MRKNRKKVIELISKLAKDLKIEDSTIWYFLAIDLERIIDERLNIHSTQLSQLENEMVELAVKEKELINKLDLQERQLISKKEDVLTKTNAKKKNLEIIENEKNKKIDSLISEIERLNRNIDSLNEKIVTKKNEIVELRGKLDTIESEYNNEVKEEKKIRYNIMMSFHKFKEQSSLSNKFVKISLYVFTFLGILIALYFILTKK